MKKIDILFFMVTFVLLSLFSGIVITGLIREESFCSMMIVVAVLFILSFISSLIFYYKSTKFPNVIRKMKFDKLNEILGKVKFPEESLVDTETVTTEMKSNGDKENIVTTRKRNLNAELCKKWIDSIAEL